MLGFLNTPNKLEYISYFEAAGATSWQSWTKPKNVKLVYILCLGGGGGGGSGQRNLIGFTKSGGAGGGASGYTKALFDASMLPDMLYINVGLGGAGGVGSNVGGAAGALSYVSVQPNSTTQNIVCASGNVGAGGANGISAGGAGSTAFTGATPISHLGLLASSGIAGTAGTASPSAAPGASVTIANMTTGGASAGGTPLGVAYDGGGITAAGIFPFLSGGLGTSVAGATAGSGRSILYTDFRSDSFRHFPLFTGGTGAGGSYNGNGGTGGNGSYGSGGGGGGPGTSNSYFSGPGGKGGDGFVIIAAW